LFKCIDQAANKAGIVDGVMAALKELHKLRVLHCDAEPRNMLYDASSGDLMLVDFERAEFRGHHRQTLGSISPNGQQDRKRKRGMPWKQDDFAREMQSAVDTVSRCV